MKWRLDDFDVLTPAEQKLRDEGGALFLAQCHFPDTPILRDARFGSLGLNGSSLGAGLTADRMEARLLGAKLGGTLDCDGAEFAAVAGADEELNLDAARIQEALPLLAVAGFSGLVKGDR